MATRPANRIIVWSFSDLPPRPEGLTELRLENRGRFDSENPPGAIFRLLQAFYDWRPDGAPELDETEAGETRFTALLNAVTGRGHRLEYEQTIVETATGTGTELVFWIVQVEVPRLTDEMMMALPLVPNLSQKQPEQHTYGPDTRIWYWREGNLALVEQHRGDHWVKIDEYNPRRVS